MEASLPHHPSTDKVLLLGGWGSSVMCSVKKNWLKRNQEARLVLRPCPSCRGRKRVRNSVKQSQPSELYALHLHCQLSSSSNPGTALLRGAVWCCLCFTSRSLSSIRPSFSTCPNETYSFWQNESRMCGLSPQSG